MSKPVVTRALSLVAGSLLLAVPGAAQQAPPAKQTLRATVPLGAQTPIVIQTAPMARVSCSPQRQVLRQAARGCSPISAAFARFFVKPKEIGSNITRLTVHCEKNGAVTNHDIELRVADAPNADFPSPPPLPKPVGRERPTLSAAEAQSLSDEELIKRGYPLPPDENLSPDGYQLWLRDVTHPAIIVDPGLIRNPFTRHDYGHTRNAPATSSNWSGVELRGSGGPFAWVSSWWVVPTVAGISNVQTNSSTWVGIDGDNNDVDLAQAGTEQDASIIASTLTTTYRAWTELLPNQPVESALAGVPINPGDTVFTEVWIGSVGGGPSLTAPSPVMTVCLEDLTGPIGVGGCFNYTSLAGTLVGGGEAEWIMERPSECDAQGNNCSLANLADFGSVPVFTTNILARRSNSGRHQGYSGCCGAGSLSIDMTSDGTATGTTLDTVNLNGGTINFVWLALH